MAKTSCYGFSIAKLQSKMGEKMNIGSRSIHLVDIENQMGGAVSSAAISKFFEHYCETVGIGEQDHVVVGVSSSQALMELPLSLMGAYRFVFMPGTDGADKALQDVMLNECLPERFSTIICASGDGGFVPAISALTAEKAHVIVAAPLNSIAKTMRMAAHQTIELSIDYLEQDVA
ncbi:hypothetical protein [Arthrobacter sunyaminii]|uniref:NYN domain-containing protein n=1 Tax=Arthrobacter sunyaminii TaxID=2816859 RepID=A0A975S6R4_9MICC|nr:hypothetical protein [Arthrobacter sunyaminii]MBO0907794.1 hypothetical protein [Arthrobacter sunyaminii]QWQ36854.1 hypothetical protein KG104_03380 [Arthrobacter sunyaminii]